MWSVAIRPGLTQAHTASCSFLYAIIIVNILIVTTFCAFHGVGRSFSSVRRAAAFPWQDNFIVVLA